MPPSDRAARAGGSRNEWRATLLLFGLVALAYWPVVHCGFVWDDDDYVTQNPLLRTAAGIWRIWFEPTSLPQYYPLVHTTFWLEYRLWGDNPLGYHLVNVLLHGGSCWLLLRLLRRLAVPGAWFAAALFAVHPVLVESVAWITERKNVLSLFCMLLAAQQWQRWRDDECGPEHEPGQPRTWWRATAWFTAALLAKTVTNTLPAALLVVQWWRRGRLTRRDVVGVLPWFVLGAVAGGFTAQLEATHVHATGAPWQLAGAERLLVAGRAPWFYLGSLGWPAGLCFNYARWQLDTGSLLQWLPVAATMITLLATIAFRRRLGRGAAATLLLFGGMLMPALGFFDVYPFRFAYVADHFEYHASIAVFAAVGAMAARYLPPRVFAVVAGLVLATLTTLANLQTRTYRDLETSWRATLERNPTSMLALDNLGVLLIDRGDVAAAKPLLEHCLALHPDSYEALANLGQIAHQGNDLDTARRYYERSLAIRPDNAVVLRNFAELHRQQGHPELALPLVQRALELGPDFFDGHVTLATVADALGRYEDAVANADWVLRRRPDAIATRLVAAHSLLALGRFDEAAQNAGWVLGRMPGTKAAQDVFASAFAHVLQQRPTEGLAAQVAHSLQSGHLDAAVLVPKLAAALRSLGASAHADALER